jgi:hypothetical protein
VLAGDQRRLEVVTWFPFVHAGVQVRSTDIITIVVAVVITIVVAVVVTIVVAIIVTIVVAIIITIIVTVVPALHHAAAPTTVLFVLALASVPAFVCALLEVASVIPIAIVPAIVIAILVAVVITIAAIAFAFALAFALAWCTACVLFLLFLTAFAIGQALLRRGISVLLPTAAYNPHSQAKA